MRKVVLFKLKCVTKNVLIYLNLRMHFTNKTHVVNFCKAYTKTGKHKKTNLNCTYFSWLAVTVIRFTFSDNNKWHTTRNKLSAVIETTLIATFFFPWKKPGISKWHRIYYCTWYILIDGCAASAGRLVNTPVLSVRRHHS